MHAGLIVNLALPSRFKNVGENQGLSNVLSLNNESILLVGSFGTVSNLRFVPTALVVEVVRSQSVKVLVVYNMMYHHTNSVAQRRRR